MQQEKFDKDCQYIKKYIPELKDIESKDIHTLGEYDDEKLEDILQGTNYPKPIVDHKEQRQEALEAYKAMG